MSFLPACIFKPFKRYNGYWYLERGILYTPLVRQRDVFDRVVGSEDFERCCNVGLRCYNAACRMGKTSSTCWVHIRAIQISRWLPLVWGGLLKCALDCLILGCKWLLDWSCLIDRCVDALVASCEHAFCLMPDRHMTRALTRRWGHSLWGSGLPCGSRS